MKYIYKTELAAKAAERWKKQYFDENNKTWRYGEDKKEVYNRLIQLGPSPNPQDVNRAIGNDSWTDCKCNECDRDVNCVVQIGDELDCDSQTANVCVNCIKKAFAGFDK